MIVVAHLAMFLLLFGLGLPFFGAFNGGLLALVAAAVGAEVVVVVAAVVASLVTKLLGINPLLARNKAEGIASAFIFVAMSGYFYTLSRLFGDVFTLSLGWSLVVSALVVGALAIMVRVKRALIARSYR